MQLNDQEKHILKNFARSREYEVVKKVILKYAQVLTSTQSINTSRRHSEIGADIEARNQLAKELKKFLNDVAVIGQELIKKRVDYK